MSDENQPWSPFGRKSEGIPRHRQKGLEVWRLRHPTDCRMQSCEIRDHSKVAAGWDVTLLLDDELVLSRRCVDETEARFVANARRQDALGTGWRVDNPSADESAT